MILKDKVAVIYGGAGAIGAAVAQKFAGEGARVFLAGRTKATLKQVADEIAARGGKAEIAVVDALDEANIDQHLKDVVGSTGRIDISFNATGISHKGVQGISLLDLSPEGYLLPINTYLRSNFLTAKISSKYMIARQAGVILTATATAGRVPFPNVGGIAPTWAAIEALSRGFAVEMGPKGIRVVCIRAEGMPETPLLKEVIKLHEEASETAAEGDLKKLIRNVSMLQKLPNLEEFANMAAFMVSDGASSTTAAVINVSCGRIAD